MSKYFNLSGLLVKPADGWQDVTGEEVGESSPYELIKEHGVGAFHFSVAIYFGGRKPDFNVVQLWFLLDDFASGMKLENGRDAFESESPMQICARSYDYPPGHFLRVWYCSDGLDLAKVTYTCEKGEEWRELDDCEQMIASMRFAPNPNGRK